MVNFQEKANFIWQVADDILRGPFKQHEYGDVILPFVVLRRLDCVLEKRKDKVVETYKSYKKDLKEEQLKPILLKATGGLKFYNTSDYDLQRLTQDAKNIDINFKNYMNGYSDNVREILDNFQVGKIVTSLSKNSRLFILVDKFTEIDLHPDVVKNHEMGYIFEDILRRFSELSNEAAGQHYTPREVIRLMVNLLFEEHKGDLKGQGIIRTIFDPACGTGGMLTTAKDHILGHINSDAQIRMFGQEINPQTFAIAKSDMLIVGEDADNIRGGSSFSEDKFKGQRFDYMLCNPPFGQSWKSEQDFIDKEAENPYGRFSAGLPRVSDGALLFIQHMISKMESSSRIAIILNGSPLFTGDAGSGESEIRKWIIENDWLETIVALPTELFYNTGIATYIWVVTNRKPKKRKGKVQLINVVNICQKMRKSLGNKRNYISEEQIMNITKIYAKFENSEYSKIYDNEFFGYTKVTVERPLIEKGKVVKDKNGDPKPAAALRNCEKVPLTTDINEYFEREVRPHATDAWMDRSKDKIGYEINLTRCFYQHKPLRPLQDIKTDILVLEKETEGLLGEIYTMTKGLDFKAKMKDSGIEWLGKIPTGWAVKQLKHLADDKDYSFVDGPFGSDLKSEEYVESGIPLIQLNNISVGEHILNSLKFISEEKGAQLFKHKTRPNDVVIAKMADPVARAAKVKPDYKEYVIVADCIKFSPANHLISSDYLVYAMNSPYVKAQAETMSTGTTRIRIGLTDAKRLKVLLPQLKDQQSIVSYLDHKTHQIDILMEKEQKMIELLKEYRTALVSEVVTAKLDVRVEE